MPQNQTPIDFGYVVEGVVEQDPVTGQCTICTYDQSGKPLNFDVHSALRRYHGQEVRFILTSFDTINRLEEMTQEERPVQAVSPSPRQGG